jgi:hypothetical protein
MRKSPAKNCGQKRRFESGDPNCGKLDFSPAFFLTETRKLLRA